MSRRNKRRNNRTVKTKEVYVPIYTSSDYDKDEKSFNNSIKNNIPVDWRSFSRLLINDLCNNTKIIETGYIGNVKIEDADMALKSPRLSWRTLLAVSEELMRVSPHYFRLNNYYSNMALFCWGIDLYDVKENANITTIKKLYSNLSAKLESMNLKHEFSKIMKVLPYQDIFCGLVCENQSDFFLYSK